MLVVLRADATPAQVEGVCCRVREMGLTPQPMSGTTTVAVYISGEHSVLGGQALLQLPGVVEVIPLAKPYKLVARDHHPADTVINLRDGVRIGGGKLTVIAGPCAVESRDQILRAAELAAKCGAHVLRGGAFKLRTSPYSFQGLGEAGLKLLAEAREKTGLSVITEAKDVATVPIIEQYVDIIQVGMRNMQNFALLECVGRSAKPIMLKRGQSATIEEWLLAAEYIMNQGNHQVFLCERGIRTFEPATRNTLDLNAVPVLRRLTHLPVAVDPSHGIGVWYGVPPLAQAAVAAGADALMVEIHPDPSKALSDGMQSLSPEAFCEMMDRVKAIAEAVGRPLAPRSPPHV